MSDYSEYVETHVNNCAEYTCFACYYWHCNESAHTAGGAYNDLRNFKIDPAILEDLFELAYEASLEAMAPWA